MSIGKSSIKRAANNGYSNVKTSAPDMENSVVVEEVKEVAPVATPTPAPAPETPKKASAKAKKPAAKKAPVKKTCAPKSVNKEAEKAVRLGDDMPYYLL